jgi:dipeptidyl aminopeptidase/acylaminoacyl peptidase
MGVRKLSLLLAVASNVFVTVADAQTTDDAQRWALYSRYFGPTDLRFPAGQQFVGRFIRGGIIEPHWMADGSSFWYVAGAPESTVIYVVEPKADTQRELFDVLRLRAALAPLLGHEPPHEGIPFRGFAFAQDETAVQFAVEDREFVLQLKTYAIEEIWPDSTEVPSPWAPRLGELASPDGPWVATIKDHDVWLRSSADGREVQLTTDGIEDFAWSLEDAEWSPDGSKLAVGKSDIRGIPKEPLVTWLAPTPEVEWVPFPTSGGAIPRYEPFIIDARSREVVRVTLEEDWDGLVGLVGWRPDGSDLLLWSENRLANTSGLVAANPGNGSSRTLVTEQSETNHCRCQDWFGSTGNFAALADGFVFTGEAGDWIHLAYYDWDGNLVRQLTHGAFEVNRLVTVDEETGWVYFTARGFPHRPYDRHLYRVNLDGRGPERLTDAQGNHDYNLIWRDPRQMIRFSPSKEFFLDTYSTVTAPPVVELRRADGSLVRTLSRANIDPLQKELKWTEAEAFTAKAADGMTDLHGVLFKPHDFDPGKQYPVIDVTYRYEVVSWTFTPAFIGWWARGMAQLGFVTVMVDARGTSGRGEAFRQAFLAECRNGELFCLGDCYGSQYPFPDHVAVLQQLAAERPYMDLGRVGNFGLAGSTAVMAMLLEPEVYHVGVAVGAPIDPYSLQRNVESVVGLPADNPEAYEMMSLARWADRLSGKLLLIKPTRDERVYFSRFMRVLDTFIQAGKPIDLLLFPDEVHGMYMRPGTVRYVWDAVGRYFREHLRP